MTVAGINCDLLMNTQILWAVLLINHIKKDSYCKSRGNILLKTTVHAYFKLFVHYLINKLSDVHVLCTNGPFPN